MVCYTEIAGGHHVGGDRTFSIRTYALISQTEMRALVYTRDANGRLNTLDAAVLEGPDATIEISDLGITLSFKALYEDVDLPRT